MKALKRSPLALDLYAWATYTAYQTDKTGRSRQLSWELLHKQFGAEYKEINNFQTKARVALRKVKTVYPAFRLEFRRGGVEVLPCKPSVKTLKPCV